MVDNVDTSPERQNDDSLAQAWEEAFNRMHDTVDDKEIYAALVISVRSDPDQVATWLEAQRPHLRPETIFFLEASEAIKRSSPQQR